MSVEYDLVVIGNTTVGIYAAVAAAKLKARVALVAQGEGVEIKSAHDSFREVGQILQTLNRVNQLGLCEPAIDLESLQWAQTKAWATEISNHLQELNSPAVLASLGIEFIAASGEFFRKPQPGFAVNGRVLRSRNFLIVTAQTPLIPNIEGLRETGYLTAETAFQTRPATLVIIGDEAAGVEWAQTFSRLGSYVTLIVNQFLPQVDREAAFLVQAQLEAEGIRVLTEMQVTQVKQIQNKKWVQAGNQAIETDEILLAIGSQPNLERLNLEAMGVRSPLQVNPKLQTKNPHIYFCRTLHQADIVVKNALFVPWFKYDDRRIPQAVFSSPEIAWIGLTEPQAVQTYGKDILVARQSFKTLAKAQIQGETTGFCKIITRQTGEILGAHIVGIAASELITPIALCMQQKLKIQSLTNLALPSLSAILSNVVADWHAQKLKRSPKKQDFLENFFSWRRSRFKP